MFKVCFKCKVEKPCTAFYKHKAMKDGYLGKCKTCSKSDVKANSLKVGAKYDFSLKGFFRVLYKTQVANSKTRGHETPNYTKEELSQWCYENNFQKLFDTWVESGYSNELKPSTDRLDTFKGYTLDNLELVTWKENRRRQAEDIKQGRGTGGKRCKAVSLVDITGNVLVSYLSMASATRAVGYDVHSKVKHQTPTVEGYYWKVK